MPHEDQRPELKDYNEFDLGNLELDHLDLEDDPPFSPTRWLILTGLLGLVGFVIWFPNSDAYRMSPNGQTYFFIISALAIVIGIFGGRWLWAWLEESAERYARNLANQPEKPTRVVSATERWLTLLGAIGSLVAVALFSNDHSGPPGQGPSENWWIISLGALLSASLGGRWLFIHANRPQDALQPSPPRELPKWFKWITFSVLVAGALFAVFGNTMGTGGPSIFDSSTFGAIGLVVGTFGAIWLAKRFDELERHFKDSNKK